VSVSVVECPDLSKAPFHLAGKGLGGSPCLIEVGGPTYLLPLVQRDKLYDLVDIPKVTKVNPAFIIGAGAGPFKTEGTNCEGIMNLIIENGRVDQQMRIAKIDKNTNECLVKKLNNSTTEFGLLANLFISEGLTSNVLQVHVANRIGNMDFIASMRTTLSDNYGHDDVIGIGGAFLMKNGKGKYHVMPDFSTTPINNDQQVNEWLRFFDFDSPMVAMGTFVTGEYELDLRVQHFHAFSNDFNRNAGGHYHYDTTPDIVEYLGYFNLGQNIYRVDAPVAAHNYGKD